MKFKDTFYGDLTNKTYKGVIVLTGVKLTSFEGCPNKIVDGYLERSNNRLKSLKGCPEELGSFYCNNNKLTSLEFSPKKIKGRLDCFHNKLQSLEYCPKEIRGSLFLSFNPDLKDIKGLIIKYGIKAERYYTDDLIFSFNEIKEEFEKYQSDYIIKKDLFSKIKSNDYGLSI